MGDIDPEPEDDPRVIACRHALAYHKVSRAIDEAIGQLSQPGVARLVSQLIGVSSRMLGISR